MSWLRAWLVVLVALAAWCGMDDAAAHASLVAATPADGAVLQQAPREVVLQFDEPVSPLAMRLVDARGMALALPGAARAQGTRIRVALPSLQGGAFVFSWRVVSADAHPVAGSIVFTLGKDMHASHPVPAAAPDSRLHTTMVATRFVRDVLLLAACGAALFVVGVGGFSRQRAVLDVAGLGALLAVAGELWLQGVVLAGDGASMVDAFRAASATTAGTSALVMCAGLIVVVLGARAGARAALLLGGLGAAASVALTGHAAAAQPTWLGMALVAGHAVMAAFWFGSLIALGLSVSLDASALARTLRRFSRLAMPAVVVLAMAGATFAAMQLESLGELRASRYGQLVLVKVGLLLGLLALAACNRFVLASRLETGDQRARAWLRRTIVGELLLIAIVLGVTANLSHTSPHAHTSMTQQLHGASAHQGSVTVTPGRPGRNVVVVTLRDEKGGPLAVEDARLVLAKPGTGIEPIERPLVRDAEGNLRHEGSEMSFRGTWQLAVEGRIGDFEEFRLHADVEIR